MQIYSLHDPSLPSYQSKHCITRRLNWSMVSCLFHLSNVKWASWSLHSGFEILRIWYRAMMTSSNGNIFRVTGHVCWEFTGSQVISPHKGQWPGALMFYLISVLINSWVDNREAGHLRRYRAHYDVAVMRNGWGRDVGPFEYRMSFRGMFYITCFILQHPQSMQARQIFFNYFTYDRMATTYFDKHVIHWRLGHTIHRRATETLLNWPHCFSEFRAFKDKIR